MVIKELEILSDEIRKNLHDVTSTYFLIGESLVNLNNSQGYKCKNYEDIFHYADVELKLDKSKTSRLMNIFKKFGNEIAIYKNYTYSQLREMINLSDEELKQCSPTLTIKEILSLKLKSDIKQSNASAEEKKIINIETKIDNSEIDKLNKEIEMLQKQVEESNNKKVANIELLEIEQLKKDVANLKAKLKNTDGFLVYLKQELKAINNEQSNKLLNDLDNYITTGKVPNKIKLLSVV